MPITNVLQFRGIQPHCQMRPQHTSLSGNHQHQALAVGMGAHQERDERAIRVLIAVPMQVDPRFGLHSAASQPGFGMA